MHKQYRNTRTHTHTHNCKMKSKYKFQISVWKYLRCEKCKRKQKQFSGNLCTVSSGSQLPSSHSFLFTPALWSYSHICYAICAIIHRERERDFFVALCTFLIKSEKPMRCGPFWGRTRGSRGTRGTGGARGTQETMNAAVELVKVQCQWKSGNQLDNIDS